MRIPGAYRYTCTDENTATVQHPVPRTCGSSDVLMRYKIYRIRTAVRGELTVGNIEVENG